MHLTFEGCKPYKENTDWNWLLVGLPLDVTETYRPGAKEGPDAIRNASVSIETYSPFLDLDLSEYNIADYGNINLDGLDIERAIEIIYKKARELSSYKIGFFGGEHTVSLGILKAMKERYENLYVVVADAHTDLRDEYEGQKINHATWLKRAIEFIQPENIILLGVRSGTREEFAHRLLEMREDADLDDGTIHKLEKADAVYLSIDIDALDAPYVPGCGNPEPGGLHYKEMEELVHWLGTSTNLVGFDIVEVAPKYDVSQITAITAARLAREIIASSLARV
ncbi:MAG: agmatinase [Actinobacteria bacterium]|nr:agmatinase [Actinomycetota bacterium]